MPELRFEHSGLNTVFTPPTEPSNPKSFDAYKSQAHDFIERGRVDLPSDQTKKNKLIDANMPFGHNSTTSVCGVLIVHGLFTSPGFVKNIAQVFIDKNYSVRVPLLTGHGTRPGDLKYVQYESWIQNIEYVLGTFPSNTTKIVVIGHSAGAAVLINILQKPDRDQRIKAAVLIAPALGIANPLISLTSIMRKAPFGLEWFFKAKEESQTSYESIHNNSAYQVYSLIQSIDKKDALINIPLFTVATETDAVVSYQAIVKFLFQQGNQHNNQCVIYSEEENHSKAVPENTTYVSVANSDQKIINVSHHGLVNAPENEEYGMNRTPCKRHYEDFKRRFIYDDYLLVFFIINKQAICILVSLAMKI